MFTFVACLFIFGVLGYAMGEWKSKEDLGGPLASLLSVFIGSIIALIIALGLGEVAPVEWSMETKPLAAVHDSRAMTGSFFLGTGSLREADLYVYWEKQQDGAKVRRTLSKSSDIKVYEEDDRRDAVLKVYTRRVVDPWSYWAIKSSAWRFEFFVPKGTIDLVFGMN